MNKYILTMIFCISLTFLFSSCDTVKTSDNDMEISDQENTDKQDEINADNDNTYADDDSDYSGSEGENSDDIDPCSPNPCENIANSTEKCISDGTDFICECLENYIWNNDIDKCTESILECNDFPVCGSIKFSGGAGTETCPYFISTPEDLNNIRNCLKGHFFQINDIDLKDILSDDGAEYNEGKGWIPIGTGVETDSDPALKFRGSYNGNNYVIKNLMINRPEEMAVGLFGVVEDAEISNTIIKSAEVSGGGGVGILVGATGYSIIFNSSTSGNVTGSQYTGGLAGGIGWGSTASNCSSSANVDGGWFTGGLAGSCSNGIIKESFSTGFVKGDEDAGGLVGYLEETSSIINSYSTATVESGRGVGGLIGWAYRGFVTNCYSTGKITAYGESGGLIGLNDYEDGSNIVNSFWDIETSGFADSYGGTGKATGEMTKIDTFNAFWDFDNIWDIDAGKNGGYPFLRSKLAPDCSVAKFDGGSGTESDPFQVSKPEHLDNMRYCLDKHFIQTADIDLSNYISGKSAGWNPIGSPEYGFNGYFNGNNYSINGLLINSWLSNYAGLFGFVSGGKITNLIIADSDIKGNNYIGIVAGYIKNTVLKEIDVSGKLAGTNFFAGGITGKIDNAVISEAQSSAVIGGYVRCGGLAGYAKNSTISRSSGLGNIYCEEAAGGLIGENDNSEISESYTTGSVAGNYFVGGFIGLLDDGIIENCYSLASVDGYQGVGGFLGDESQNITSLIRQCYCAGAVTGTGNYVGGFSGSMNIDVSSSSYWDTEASGQAEGFAGTGKTTEEMKNKNTYQGWNFSTVWNTDSEINDGYPYLQWQK